jgi:hypothetical protein
MWWRSSGASAEVRAKSELLYAVTSSATVTLGGLLACAPFSEIPQGRVIPPRVKFFL